MILVLGELLTVHPNSILGELHSEDPLPQTILNRNAAFSTNGNDVLLIMDSPDSPAIVAPVPRGLPVEITFGRTHLQSTRATQRATTLGVSQPLSVTELTNASPRDRQGHSDNALDFTFPIS